MDIDREYLRFCGYQPEEVTWDYKATKQYKTFAAGAKAVLDDIDRKGYVCPANKWNQELYEKSAAEVCPTCDHYEKDCIVYGRKKRKE